MFINGYHNESCPYDIVFRGCTVYTTYVSTLLYVAAVRMDQIDISCPTTHGHCLLLPVLPSSQTKARLWQTISTAFLQTLGT